MITTKGGSKEAKSKVTYNGSYALSSPVEFYDYLADYSRALTMQTVSYTHLDVYKIQVV